MQKRKRTPRPAADGRQRGSLREFGSRAKVSWARCSVYNKVCEAGKDDDRGGVGAVPEKEASQARNYCVAKNATHRAARSDSSLRKERLFGMTIKLHHDDRDRAVIGPGISKGACVTLRS